MRLAERQPGIDVLPAEINQDRTSGTDGSETPGPDNVIIDFTGEFIYNYSPSGTNGQYLLEVLDSTGALLATTTFTAGSKPPAFEPPTPGV